MCMRKQLRGSKERGAWARELFYILHTADSFLAKVVYFFSRLMRIVKLQASSHSSLSTHGHRASAFFGLSLCASVPYLASGRSARLRYSLRRLLECWCCHLSLAPPIPRRLDPRPFRSTRTCRGAAPSRGRGPRCVRVSCQGSRVLSSIALSHTCALCVAAV